MILLIASSLLFKNRLAAQADEPLKITIEAPKEVIRGEPICLKYRYDDVEDIQQTPILGKDGVSWISCVATDSEGKKLSNQSEPKLYVPSENLEGPGEHVHPGKPMIGEVPLRIETSTLAPGRTQLVVDVRLPVVNAHAIESGTIHVIEEAELHFEVNVVQNDLQLSQDASALMLDVEKSRRLDYFHGTLIDNGMDEKSLRKLLLFNSQTLRPLIVGASERGFTPRACGMVAQALTTDPTVEALKALEHFFARGLPEDASQWIRPLTESEDRGISQIAIKIMKRSGIVNQEPI